MKRYREFIQESKECILEGSDIPSIVDKAYAKWAKALGQFTKKYKDSFASDFQAYKKEHDRVHTLQDKLFAILKKFNPVDVKEMLKTLEMNYKSLIPEEYDTEYILELLKG